jgi:hypothetical protein
VECNEEVNEIGKVEYESMKGQFVDAFDDGDDDEETERDFLMNLKNGDWINHEAFFEV